MYVANLTTIAQAITLEALPLTSSQCCKHLETAESMFMKVPSQPAACYTKLQATGLELLHRDNERLFIIIYLLVDCAPAGGDPAVAGQHLLSTEPTIPHMIQPMDILCAVFLAGSCHMRLPNNCTDPFCSWRGCMPVVIGEFLADGNGALGKDDDVILQLPTSWMTGSSIAGVAVGVTGVVQQVRHVACRPCTGSIMSIYQVLRCNTGSRPPPSSEDSTCKQDASAGVSGSLQCQVRRCPFSVQMRPARNAHRQEACR